MAETTKPLYFFASVQYSKPIYDYYMHVDGYKSALYADVFVLDHYPSKEEIIQIVLGSNGEEIDQEIMSYSELSEEQYNAYHRK